VTRLRDQGGFTLPELLTAMLLFMFILGGTLDVFDGYVTRNRTNSKMNDATDVARTAMDRMARQLRNLASPTNANVKSIDQATDDDLVFQTVDPIKRRVRYCLKSSNPANETLYRQTQAFPISQVDPGMPSTSECPAPTGSSGWATSQVVATNVVNRVNGQDRKVFHYADLGTGGDTAKVTGVRAQLYVDMNPGKPPAEVSIASGDFLRNQNQKPTVLAFSLVQSPAGSRNFIMNGSEALDPEGRTLDYYWYTGTGNTAGLPGCQDASTQTGGGFTCIGHGITLQYTFPASARGSAQTITLKVIDPGGLYAVAQKTTPVLP
jgi:type II secretory pathway pseudopilin PulG